jgi:hypothetical protein
MPAPRGDVPALLSALRTLASAVIDALSVRCVSSTAQALIEAAPKHSAATALCIWLALFIDMPCRTVPKVG